MNTVAIIGDNDLTGTKMDGNQLHVRNGGKEGADSVHDGVRGEAQIFFSFVLSVLGQVGGDQGMAVLKDLNDFEAGHDKFVKNLAAGL